MSQTFTGHCLCGAVTYSCSTEPMMMGHCHCDDCRRSSGSGHCSHLAVPEPSIAIKGETKGYARPADSGNVVTRHFCPTCGSALYSTNAAMPGLIFLRASTLDDPEVFKPQMHVYAANAASWDARQEGLPTFDKMPPGM